MKQKLRQWLWGLWIDVKEVWRDFWLTTGPIWTALIIIALVVMLLVGVDALIKLYSGSSETPPNTPVVFISYTPEKALTSTPVATQATRTPLPTFEVPSSPTVTNTPLPTPTQLYIIIVQTKVVDPTAVPTKWEPSPAPTWDWSTPWPTMPPKGTPWTPPPQPTYEPTIFATMRTPAPTITPKDPPTLVPTPIPTDIPTSEPTPSYPNPD